MYNGWTPTQAEINYNAWRNALQSVGYSPKLNTEEEADKISLFLLAADAPVPDVWEGDADSRTLAEVDRDLQSQEWQDTYRSLLP